MKNYFLLTLTTLLLIGSTVNAQNVGINANGSLPDSSAILDVSSNTSGLLIPRMTEAERDAIALPANGLQVYNLTSNTIDVFKGTEWKSLQYYKPGSNLVYVSCLGDLPEPNSDEILLESDKMYVFSGMVNISPNFININGAGLKGTDPSKDGILSSVNGAVLRSYDANVYMDNLSVVPFGALTSAYEFTDATSTKYCSLLTGCSVGEAGVVSNGVGQISGFSVITVLNNFWSTSKGLKVTGNVGKFVSAYSFITGINNGPAIEFLSGLVIEDIDLSNNYFVFSGQTGIKVNTGSQISHGRMTTNLFRGVGVLLDGFNSYTPEWEMLNNSTGIPNSRSFAFMYMNNNTISTSLPIVSTYYKVAGNTIALKEQKFTSENNKITYQGKRSITTLVFATVGGKSPVNGADFSIVIAKNGVVLPAPNSSMGEMIANQGFQITLETEVDLNTNDYIEVFIKSNNSNTDSAIITDLQFRVSEQ